MWEQLVSPNLDPEIIEGNKVLTDWLGWCLAYGKNAYKAFGNTGDTAWKAWLSTKFKHTDELPTGVYVPIWFSGYKGMGHVAIFYKRPDGQIQIWSSPISHKPYADVWGSIDEIERRYGVTFVGWSEDIANLKVIGEKMSEFTKKPIPADLVRQHLDNFTNGHAKVKTSDPVCQNRFELNDENWGGEFWKGLNFQQKDIITALDKEIVELRKQIGTTPPSDPDSVSVTKTSLWDWFKNLPFIKKG